MSNQVYASKEKGQKDPGSRFGIERETLRVTNDGKLSQSPHPFTKESLSRDFCENQLEIITPVCNSIDEAINALVELSKEAETTLDKMDEKIWMCSNPPHFESKNEIPIAQYDGDQIAKHHYRIKLQRRYGKALMLYSGIHFNVSFSNDFIGKDTDGFYMNLLKQSMRYSWLITMLTAASPVYDVSFDKTHQPGKSVFDGYASMRNSKRGYWNQFVPVLDYGSLSAFCDSVQNLIDKGALFSEGELYMPVRIKCKGANSLAQLRNGVDHIELRMFDLNPLNPLGIIKEDLEFAYLWLIYLTTLSDFSYSEQLQKESIKNHQNAAKLNLDNVKIDGLAIMDVANTFLQDMKDYFIDDGAAVSVIDAQMQKLGQGQRYAEKLYEMHMADFQGSVLNRKY